MAESTGFITNISPYSNRDLSTIFAPINNIDYGTFTASETTPTPIGEGWSTFYGIFTDSTVQAQNVTLNINNTGFIINKPGIYRLKISLRFGGPSIREDYQPMVFILNSVSTIPVSNGYTFTPCPSLDNIYSFGGLSVAGSPNILNPNGTVTNRNNDISLENALQTNANGNEYMFAFELVSLNTNIATFEITFTATAGQFIYPQIRCRGGADPQTTLASGRWFFTKLSK